MLLFTCARDSGYQEIKKYGLQRSGMGHRLMRSYDAAAAQCSGRILVVELSRSELEESQIRNDIVVAPAVRLQCFRNLNPYAQVRPITAAGGILVRRRSEDPQVLLIRRRGVWDLPKGKQDPGESVQDCALREVREELGIKSAEIICPLENTVHGYREGDQYLLKTTYWFLMRTEAKRFTPQSDEDIDKIAWMDWKEARDKVGFPTLRALLKSARPVAQKKA